MEHLFYYLILIHKKEPPKNYNHFEKDYTIIAKPTEVTYKLTDSTKKKIVQHRNNLLPYYPKEYALSELTQLYSFTGLKVVQNNTQTEQNETVHDVVDHEQNQQQSVTRQNTKTQKKMQKKNRKKIEKILPQDHKIKKENQNIDNHHDLEVNHVKITKHSSHNLKY